MSGEAAEALRGGLQYDWCRMGVGCQWEALYG